MRYESAELAKISINICLVASISAANTLAEICEKIGADWSEIVPALRLDRRIGPYSYIVPGLGISGGNLERDLYSVLHLTDIHNTDGGVISSCLFNSQRRKNWPFEILKDAVLKSNPEATIAVLGLAYKENTHSTKNSPALLLIERLSTCKIKAYDPLVSAHVAGNHVVGASSALDAANGADAVAIMTPWPEFSDILPSDFAIKMKGHTIIDPYGMLDAKKVKAAGLDYFTLGKSPIFAS
jgi:UDPglucose 6-dehydrogenase